MRFQNSKNNENDFKSFHAQREKHRFSKKLFGTKKILEFSTSALDPRKF